MLDRQTDRQAGSQPDGHTNKSTRQTDRLTILLYRLTNSKECYTDRQTAIQTDIFIRGLDRKTDQLTTVLYTQEC